MANPRLSGTTSIALIRPSVIDRTSDHPNLKLPSCRADLSEWGLELADMAATLPEHEHDSPRRLDLIDQVDPKIGKRALQRSCALDEVRQRDVGTVDRNGVTVDLAERSGRLGPLGYRRVHRRSRRSTTFMRASIRPHGAAIEAWHRGGSERELGRGRERVDDDQCRSRACERDVQLPQALTLDCLLHNQRRLDHDHVVELHALRLARRKDRDA
jgi:hypothetical protein